MGDKETKHIARTIEEINEREGTGAVAFRKMNSHWEDGSARRWRMIGRG